MARRKFVGAALFGFIGVCALATLRFFFPRAGAGIGGRFTLGYPDDFAPGISTRFKQSNGVWVVRGPGLIFVILARCTHLGCTPDWLEGEHKFKCPCHGSGFDAEGVNFEGPARRPLQRVHVELDAEGRIVADKSRLYEYSERNERGAFLPL